MLKVLERLQGLAEGVLKATNQSGQSTARTIERGRMRTARASTDGKKSGIGEWSIQLEDSWKHSQQHSSSKRSAEDSSSVAREGKREAT